MQAESTLSPGRNQVGGSAFGLVQWDPATKYTDWASLNGYSATSMTGQLNYLIYSIQPGCGEWFKNPNYPDYYLSAANYVVSNESIAYLTALRGNIYEKNLWFGGDDL